MYSFLVSPGCTRHFLGTVSDTRGILIWFRQAKSLKKQANMNLICSYSKLGSKLKLVNNTFLSKETRGSKKKAEVKKRGPSGTAVHFCG